MNDTVNTAALVEPDEESIAGGEPATHKTYYSISEVCSMTGLEPHVLRYWESEFPQLRPKKNRAGNRAYRDRDIELIEYIKRLLYDEQYTIPGARKKCATLREREAEEAARAQEPPQKLSILERKEVVKMLKEILAILRR